MLHVYDTVTLVLGSPVESKRLPAWTIIHRPKLAYFEMVTQRAVVELGSATVRALRDRVLAALVMSAKLANLAFPHAPVGLVNAARLPTERSDISVGEFRKRP